MLLKRTGTRWNALAYRIDQHCTTVLRRECIRAAAGAYVFALNMHQIGILGGNG